MVSHAVWRPYAARQQEVDLCDPGGWFGDRWTKGNVDWQSPPCVVAAGRYVGRAGEGYVRQYAFPRGSAVRAGGCFGGLGLIYRDALLV